MDEAKIGKTDFLDMTSIDSGFGKRTISRNCTFLIHPSYRVKMWWDNLISLFVVPYYTQITPL